MSRVRVRKGYRPVKDFVQSINERNNTEQVSGQI